MRKIHLSYCGLDDYEWVRKEIQPPAANTLSKMGQDIESLLAKLGIVHQWQQDDLVLGAQVMKLQTATPDAKRDLLQVILQEYGE